MRNEQIQIMPPPFSGKLTCREVWGGIHNRDLEILAGKVKASLFSAACDGGKGGDIYYFGSCTDDRITRLAVADVVGHGAAVTEVSQHVYDALSSHMCDKDSTNILNEINQRISRRGLDAMTTAVVVAYYRMVHEARILYAGHPPLLYKRKTDVAWSFVKSTKAGHDYQNRPFNIPLAFSQSTSYGHRSIPMTSGDRLFVYTDGITEAPSPTGDFFGRKRLKKVLDAHPQTSLADLKAAVLSALYRHTRDNLTHDDVTLIALEIS